MYSLGTLTILRALDHPELVALPVADALKGLDSDGVVGVAEIDEGVSDTLAFCAQYEVPLERAANCVILEATRSDREWLAACVILGSTKADVNGVARKNLDARRVSFAAMDKAVSATGMAYGAITPIGLPAEWPILIDEKVSTTQLVVIGSGIRASKLIVPGALFARLPNAKLIRDLARRR